MSPPLVVAFCLAGHMTSTSHQAIGKGRDGTACIWPICGRAA